MFAYNSITMLSDGNKIAIVMKLLDGTVMAHVAEAVVSKFNLQTQRNIIDVTNLSGTTKYLNGPSSTEIDMSFIVLGTVTTGDESLLECFKTVDNMSILELLEIVQKKAERRQP